MHHLTLVDLARLVDEAPTEQETSHLADCARCSRELAEMRLQTQMLQDLPDPPIPELVHHRIAAVLATETPDAPSRSTALHAWLRRAAAVLIFVLGGVVGTFGVAPRLQAPPATAVSSDSIPATIDQAAASLASAEAAYLRALSHYSRMTAGDQPIDPINRLTALEGILLTTRSALRAAPADPIINSYHLTAVGQRDALLDQLERESVRDEWF